MSKIPSSECSPNDWPHGVDLDRDFPAQEPPAGFADRTVSAMLARRERRVARLAPKRLGRLVLLAALVSASAWGALRVAQDLRVAPLRAVAEQDVPKVTAPGVVIVTPLPSVEAPLVSPQPKARSKARAVAAPPSELGPASEASVPPPRPILPRCQCAPGFVVCGCSD